MMNFRFAIFLAWLISLSAMLGSLYFSDIRMLEPCHLCWYQRIVIYPLDLLLGIACWRGQGVIIPYAIPFPMMAFGIALYQVIIQANPSLEVVSACGAGPSCVEKLDIGLGPITIPMLSLASQAMMIILLVYAYVAWKRSSRV